MSKGSKKHKISSKSNSQNKSERNVNPDNTGSDFNNQNNAKPRNQHAQVTGLERG